MTGQGSLDEATLGEIQNYFRNDLAPGLDRLLETDWFTKSGLAKLLATRSLCIEVAELLQHFMQLTGSNGADAEYRCRASEARTVWHLLSLCRPDSESTAPPSLIDLEGPDGRLEVLECLLTNRLLIEQNIKPHGDMQNWHRDRSEELMFWSALARFLAHSSDDPNAVADTEKYLLQCRSMLNGRESRDVIYSLMVIRHLGSKTPGFPHSMHPESGGEGSSVNKVYIAHKFIADEAAYRGTNHPIQRICDMAMRSWALGW